jgi:hypothetical protein
MFYLQNSTGCDRLWRDTVSESITNAETKVLQLKVATTD